MAGVSPTGELVLLDPDRHVFCTVALPDRPDELDAILTTALAGLPAQRRQLQKALPLINGHWMRSAPFVRHNLRGRPPDPQ